MSIANKDNRIDAGDLTIGHAVTGNVTGFVAGTGTAVVSGSKWAGASGATAYTVGDLVTALKRLGVLAP